MIDQITIVLDDEGRYIVRIGNKLTVVTTNEKELLGFIYQELENLAYFPTRPWELNKTPISIQEYRKMNNRTRAKRKDMSNVLDTKDDT